MGNDVGSIFGTYDGRNFLLSSKKKINQTLFSRSCFSPHLHLNALMFMMFLKVCQRIIVIVGYRLSSGYNLMYIFDNAFLRFSMFENLYSTYFEY